MRKIAMGLAVLVAACGGSADTEPDAVPPATPAPSAVQANVDTTESSLWTHLTSAGYQSWSHWPGTGELYTGGEPHGMLLTTYVNDIARDALAGGATTMPAGAIVVKENYMPDSTLAAVTAMSKSPGYDAGGGDWFWAKWDPAGVAEVSGRVDGCKSCHGANASADYLMTAR